MHQTCILRFSSRNFNFFFQPNRNALLWASINYSMKYIWNLAALLLLCCLINPISAQTSHTPNLILPPLAISGDAINNNQIFVASFVYDPVIVAENSQTMFNIKTNSRSALLADISCKTPENSKSICSCKVEFADGDRNIRCIIYPPSKGSYLVSLQNTLGDGGSFSLDLVPGRQASISRISIQQAQGSELVIFAIALTALVLLFTGVRFLFKYGKDKYLSKNIPKQLDQIKEQQKLLDLKYSKGQIKKWEHLMSSKELKDKKTILLKRKAELEKKHPNWIIG